MDYLYYVFLFNKFIDKTIQWPKIKDKTIQKTFDKIKNAYINYINDLANLT